MLASRHWFETSRICKEFGLINGVFKYYAHLSNDHELLESDAPLNKLLSFILVAIEGALFFD